MRRLGEARLPVEVRVDFADGRTVRETWDGKDRWKTFAYEDASKVVRAEVDPDGKIALDVDRGNNGWVAETGKAVIVPDTATDERWYKDVDDVTKAETRSVVAVPVHGLVQLVSNASRAWFLREQVSWRAVGRFAWPLLPAGALGLLLLQTIPPAAGRLIIGGFVLVATWLPKSAREGQASPHAWRLLPLGGALVGFFSTLVGATGPLLGPFIVGLELGPAATIGSICDVPLERPRQRLELITDPTYVGCRSQVLEFLHKRHRFVDAA